MFSHSLLNKETVSYQNASGFPFHWKQSPKSLLSPTRPSRNSQTLSFLLQLTLLQPQWLSNCSWNVSNSFQLRAFTLAIPLPRTISHHMASGLTAFTALIKCHFFREDIHVPSHPPFPTPSHCLLLYFPLCRLSLLTLYSIFICPSSVSLSRDVVGDFFSFF